MLSLTVHCGYPSYGVCGEEWRQADYDGYKLVQTLKGNPIKGFATLRRPNGTWVRFEESNREPAFLLWGEWAAAQLAASTIGPATLVPVPSSGCLALGDDAKGRRLVTEITSRAPGYELGEYLCWLQQLPKTSQGGPRDPQVLFNNLAAAQGQPPRRIVLVDDVVTSGGHLVACARALRARGHTVEHAICVAQTVWTHPPSMFNIAARDVEADFMVPGIFAG